MKSYITRKFKNFMKNANGKDFDKIAGNPVLLSLKVKTKGRRMLRKVASKLFPQDLSALGVKALAT